VLIAANEYQFEDNRHPVGISFGCNF